MSDTHQLTERRPQAEVLGLLDEAIAELREKK